MSKAPNYFESYRNRYSDQATGIFRPVVFELHTIAFSLRDLDLGPMTLKLNRDLHILKTYIQTENKIGRSSHSKYIA